MSCSRSTSLALWGGLFCCCCGLARGDQGGPTAQAPRQPQGALSGVTVFLSAGHGWYDTTTGWQLQRPFLHLMNEDYGNLDQINYLVHYAYNAGATIVPLKPVGYQPVEIVLDNDDPQVDYSGSWVDDTTAGRYYENGVTASGVCFRAAAAATTQSAAARYTPNLPVAGFYPVYAFTPHGADRVAQTYRIGHNAGAGPAAVAEVVVDHRLVGDGWVWLGEYYFEAGTTGFVEISNRATDGGVVVADAIRWGVGIGDYVGLNGQVSGYPRDEEDLRYWAFSEALTNAVGFQGINYMNSFYCAPVWSAEMNRTDVNNDRWRRVYLELHSNASGGSGTARGTIALVDVQYPTTNQAAFATILGDEVEADMMLLNAEWEYPWIARPNPLYGYYFQLSTFLNDDEFDATLVEVAFHDNPQDAALLCDPRVRAALARSMVHGLIKFLHTLPDSTVPLAFPPDRPTGVAALDVGEGDVRVLWEAPPTDEALGDPATGYVIYASGNGTGFAPAAVVGDVREAVLTGLQPGEIRYFRVAATNAGGESMPSETLAVRRPSSGVGDVLMVDGFDRMRRDQCPTMFFGLTRIATRPLWRQVNSHDYVRQHGAALAEAEPDGGFSSCSNEAAQGGRFALTDFAVLDWISGQERNEDITFNTAEQAVLTNFAAAGGALLVSGAQIGYDLVAAGHGPDFLHTVLGADYVDYFSNTYAVTPAAEGILAGLPAFDFDPANGAVYRVRYAERISPRPGAETILTYVGGTGGIAGLTWDAVTRRVALLTVPLETITSAAVRDQVMTRLIQYLRLPALAGDFDRDGDVDEVDAAALVTCLTGPIEAYIPGDSCRFLDADADGDVDLRDYAHLQTAWSEPE